MLRPATLDDEPFLRLALYEAAAPADESDESAESDESGESGGGAAEARPPIDVVLADDEIARYLDGWGRPGDVGLVAVDVDDPERPIGAAWFRTFARERPGYGFVDRSVPELSIAVVDDRRGQGVGRELLEGLLAAAAAGGFDRLSLSVARDNSRARHLYRSLGFVEVGDDGHSVTMVAPTT